jgi:ABC-type glycerol-3-phosphate transport system substrate-binding protein
MKYVAWLALLAGVGTAALFLRTDRSLGVKRLSFAMYKYVIYDPLYTQAGAEFQAKWNREHTEDPIEVRYDPIAEDAYSQKVTAEVVAGTAQDIFFPGDFHEYVRDGAVLDLTPYVEKYHAQAQIAKIYPELIKAHTVNGHLYGLPISLQTNVLYFNPALFDREKMPYPSADWTWADLLAAAQRLTKRDAEGRLVQSGLTPCDFWYWVIWNHGRFWTPDGSRCIVNSPESLEALQFLHDLQWKYRVCPTFSQLKDANAEVTFINNGTAMFIADRSYTAHFRELSHVNWRIAPLGRSLRGRHLCLMEGNTFVISAQTKYPDIAFQFLLFLTSPEQIKRIVVIGESLPIHSGPEENAYLLNDPTRPKGENAAYFAGMDDAVVGTDADLYNPNFTSAEFDLALLQFQTDFEQPEADVPKLLKGFEDHLNAIYAERMALPGKPSIPAFALALGLAACAAGGVIAWQVRSVKRAG